MKRYESSIPRVACAIGAMAMTAITIGLSVVLPSKMEPDSQTFVTLAVSKAFATTQCDAIDSSVCVGEVAVREPGGAAVPLRSADLQCKQQG
jgi:hypothetical protein